MLNISKLCPQCNKDFGASNTDHQCVRTIDVTDAIGNEKRWVEECATQLHDRGLSVNLVTTDPDALAFNGAENAYRNSNMQSPPKHQMDTRHVGSNQRKLIKNTELTKEMFGVRTHAERKYLTNRFANDLAARCTAEHKASMQIYCGDAIKVSNKMPAVRDNIISCYQGDHRRCKRKSFVCAGGKKKNWINKSAYLKDSFKLNNTISDTDKEKFNECINYRLGHVMLRNTKYLLSTQKAEATNRAISGTIPRNITFTKNYFGRSHAAVHGVNAGTSEAVLKECQNAGAPLTPGTRVTRKLKRMQDHDKYLKDRKKSPNAMQQRHLKKEVPVQYTHTQESDNDRYVKNASLPKMDRSYCTLRMKL